MNRDGCISDEALSQSLQDWKVSAEPPPGFEENVWQRIALAEAETARTSLGRSFREALGQWLVRPAVATGYVAALLIFGLVAGWRQARQDNARWEKAMRTRYVQTIDPYRMPRP